MDTGLSWDHPAVAELEEQSMSLNDEFISYMNDETDEPPHLGNVVRGIVVVKDDITGIEVYNSRPFWNDEIGQKQLKSSERWGSTMEDEADIIV